MKFTQLKKWFSVMAFAVTALFVTQTVRAETSPYVLMQQASDKLFADIKSNQAKIKKDPNYLRTIVRNDLLPYVQVNYAGSLVHTSNQPHQNNVKNSLKHSVILSNKLTRKC